MVPVTKFMLHVTSGIYQDHVNTKAFSSMFNKHGCNLDLAEAIKKHVLDGYEIGADGARK